MFLRKIDTPYKIEGFILFYFYFKENRSFYKMEIVKA